MVLGSLRVALDANVLIAGIRLPRWPYEVMLAAVARQFALVIPVQVVEGAKRHLNPGQQEVLDLFLEDALSDQIPMPAAALVKDNLDLVRSEKDVPIALALLAGDVDVFVTNDRDFTDPGAVAERLRDRVRIMLSANFLIDCLGWTSAELESIRTRGWAEICREPLRPV